MTRPRDEMAELGPDIETLRKLAALMPVKERLEKYRKIDRIVLHPKQQEFVDLMGTCSEVALLGANQSGKSLVGAYVLAIHLTGDYPAWWRGRRFNKAINAWAIGPTAQHVRDVMQLKLVGNIADPDGLIPLDAYDDRRGRPAISKSHGLSDAVDQLRVKHKSGGVSLLTFKSHEQGREKLQGAGIDVIWSDEDCPLSIWSELGARLISTAGIIYATFTPIMGSLPVAKRFLEEHSPQRAYVIMALTDALHIPVDRHQSIINSVPEHERDARIFGIPSAGGGKVFRTLETQIAEEIPSNIPAHWPALWGCDFGHTEKHPFAAVLAVHDRSYDTVHIIHATRIRGGLPRDHAAAIRAAMNGQGADLPLAWPHDGASKTLESGKTIAQLYRNEGLRMLPEHATFPKGGFDLEAGIALMAMRFRDGTLKVARHLREWFDEYRMYARHHETGLIIKANDDLMSATRCLLMDLRKAKEFDDHRPGFRTGEPYRRPQQPPQSQDFDLFTGRPPDERPAKGRERVRDWDVFGS